MLSIILILSVPYVRRDMTARGRTHALRAALSASLKKYCSVEGLMLSTDRLRLGYIPTQEWQLTNSDHIGAASRF